jgi:hypothetical protein
MSDGVSIKRPVDSVRPGFFCGMIVRKEERYGISCVGVCIVWAAGGGDCVHSGAEAAAGGVGGVEEGDSAREES